MDEDDEDEDEEKLIKKIKAIKANKRGNSLTEKKKKPHVDEEDEEEEPVKLKKEKPEGSKIKKKGDARCEGSNFKLMSSQFCATKFDPSSDDYRLQSIETCKSYFCPLCCAENFSG